MDRFGHNSHSVDDGQEPTLTYLASGIVADVGQLLEQQLQLVRAELNQNMQRTREAATLSAVGMGLFALAGVALVFTLGYGLNAALPTWPVWVCFACVFVVLALVGGGILYAGKQKWHAVHPFPQESAQALKENIQCLNPIRNT